MLKRDITVTFSGQIARVAFATVGGALLARALGPDNRGLFMLAVLVPRTATNFFEFGQVAVNSTFAGLYRDQRSALFAQTVLFGLISGLLCALAIALWVWLPFDHGRFEELPLAVVALAVCLAPAENLCNLLRELARGCERITSTVAITTCGVALQTLCIFVILFCLGFGLQAAMWITVGMPLALILCHVWQMRDFATLDYRKLSKQILMHSVQFGGIRTVAQIAMFLIERVSVYMLAFFAVPQAQLGYFAVALMVAEQLKIIPSSVGQAFLPRLSNNPAERLKQTPKVFRLTTIASFAVALAIAAAGPFAMIVMFGWDYVDSLAPFLALLPGLAVFGSMRVLGMDLWVRNKPQYSLINNWAALIATAAVTYLLIPPLGIVGAAIANSMGLAILSILTIAAYRKESGVPLKDLMFNAKDIKEIANQASDLLKKARSRLLGGGKAKN